MANSDAVALEAVKPIIMAAPESVAADKVRAFRRMTLVWLTVGMVLFPILLLLGLLMRLSQSNLLAVSPELFYSSMTLHGLGMVGTWYIMAMAGTGYLLTRYVKPSLVVSRLVFVATIVAVLLLVVATLLGRFITGWYFLYPLPLYPADVWQPWATACFFAFITIAGVAWTIWSLDMLRAIARRYSLTRALGWQVLFSGKEDTETPPMILIAVVSLISALAGFVAAVVLLVLFYVEMASSSFTNDALLMKNLVFYFGHILVNITMYLGVAMVYELLPSFAEKGKLTIKWMVAAAWNTSLLLVNLAYFHHLYMDFVQPGWLQTTGQIASYLVSVPAAVVTIISTLSLVFGSKMRWTLPALLFFLGVMGWAVGGLAAVVDSTIVVNFRFHNTLWVPAHFHTYFLAGVVFILLGFAVQFAEELSQTPLNGKLARLQMVLLVIGAYGFLLMFYIAGVHSVPRRYAVYPDIVAQGAVYARWAIFFIAVLLVGLILYWWDYAKRTRKAFAAL